MTKEKALLIFIEFKGNIKKEDQSGEREYSNKNNIEELSSLIISAGAEIGKLLSYRQTKPNPKYFISSGRLNNIKSILEEGDIELVVFDDEITPTQQRNLYAKLNRKVLDRTALILDIFAQRANSKEGKLQVELAQLDYLLPRLAGRGIELSRLGGGIGTRGPGETKLEVDRRKIRDRIISLKKKIDKISVQRVTQRKSRKNNIFQIALVGYTNSGKSTLLNSLTKSEVYVKNMLFSTLDSTTRKFDLDVRPEVLLTDTVGFIDKLPHQLIAAFKSTLEEVKISDLMMIVVDVSNNDFESNILSVKKVLKEIDVWGKPFFIVFNKIDKINSELLKSLRFKYRNALFVSALKKIGLEEIKLKIKKIIEKNNMNIKIIIPYNNQKIVSFIYDRCQVLDRKDLEDGILFDLNIEPKYRDQLLPFIYNKERLKIS
jgi:GTPase